MAREGSLALLPEPARRRDLSQPPQQTNEESDFNSVVMMPTFRYRFETHGERLYGFLRALLAESLPRGELEDWLEPVGMTSEWVEYFEQLSAVGLTGRVVAAGRSLSKTFADRILFRQQYRSYLNDFLLVSKAVLDGLLGFAIEAVDVADGKISDGLRKERRAWAERRRPNCYLCATYLNFEDEKSDEYCTLEHLWPSSYGGDSIAENLLPACALCNRARKADFATWATTSVQSVLRGLNPDTKDPYLLSGPALFALHNWAGQRYAIRHKTNLRDAFLQIGPWTEPRVVNKREVAYFFNLRNHDQSVLTD